MLERDVLTIGIIGAGPKGAQIATYSLLGGYRVMLEDISPVRLSEAKARITAELDAAPPGRRFDSLRRRQIKENLFTTHSMEDVSRAGDLLIEAAPEDAELQLEIFTIFDKFVKPTAILASTACTVFIADLAEMTNCPERCVGLRLTEPETRGRVLRVIGSPRTSEQTLKICADFAQGLGLVPEIVSEVPPAQAARKALRS